jgi:LuxR family transcriptional regulator, maltose regulon positive regulatory protein
MPKPSAHILRWSEESQIYELTTGEQLEQRFGAEGGLSWFDFLDRHTSFAFQGREGRLSVIKEMRPRGTGYWYAYRSHGQRTVKRYLGVAATVTIARLENVAGMLTSVIHDMPTIQERWEAPAPISLLLPKLLPPRLPSSLVARPRLLQRLDVALERKITLLVAPAGFGKTTVVNQWMNDRRTRGRLKPVAWISLDNGDNDLFRFWRYIIVACQTFQKDIGQTALASLSDALQPPFASSTQETALTFLLNDLAQQVQDGLLVLDDYHLIEEPRIFKTVTFFLDHLPPTLGILLLTRAEPLHLPLLRWRARGDLSELHTADLRFSSQETATFARQTLPTPLSDAALKQLDVFLQGWVAGLRLLTLMLPEQMTSHAVEHALISLNQRSDLSSPYQPLLDYFVTEILNAQPAQRQHFLLQTSVLSLLSGPLCDVVTGEEHSAALLEAIEQAGLFLEALDGAGGWYHFHTLFAEAIRHEAARRLGEETLRALSLRASSWYEQHAMAAEAVEAALLAHDFERAAVLIEHMDKDGQTSEQHTVRRWLELMPEATLRAYPMLCWLAALSLQVLQEEAPFSVTEHARVEALLQMAEEGWHRQDERAFPGLISALRAMRVWRQEPSTRAVTHAQRALAVLPNNRQDRRIQTFRGICLFIVGGGYMYEGRFDEARSLLLEAHACSLAGGDRHIIRGMLLLVGVCSSALGELHQAHEYYQQVLPDARRLGEREIIAQTLLGLARISYEWNQLAAAERQAQEALELALEEEVDLRNGAAFQLALLAHARGQITSAGQQLATLLAQLRVASTPQATQMLPEVLVWQARLALEAGDLPNALSSLEMLAIEEHIETRILQARFRLSQNKPREARQQLERLLPFTQNWRQVLEIQVLLSLACAACQQGYEARQWLQQALSQARGEGLVRLFLSEGEPLVRLLRQLVPTIQERALRSYAQSILHAFAQTDGELTPGTASTASLLIEPLSSQEQRVLQLLVAGETNQQIAQELVVSVNTVKDHLKHLYRKLGVSNRLQASEAARHLKLF